jgi:maleylacetoacetate isomerase
LPWKFTLYGYFRSSTSYRTRIALNAKGVAYRHGGVHLLKDGGEHRQGWYQAINPQMRVPSLVLEREGRREVLTQSLAIIEWLDETYPEPPLLPRDPIARAKCRAIAAIVACDVHPLVNVGPLNYLKAEFGAGPAQVDAWYAKWVSDGFAAIEAMIVPGPFAMGSALTLADICLVPQIFNARRSRVPLDAFPKILAVERACLELPPFAAAAPDRQPDAAS